MDKQKMKDLYKLDQTALKEKVVIALSGGVDSFVAAYLLKIQKYDLIAVTVASQWDNWEGDASAILSCHLDQKKLDEIKDFCRRLSIPHHIIRASNEFKDQVIEGWMSKRLGGKFANPCWDCHALRMELLFSKMVDLKVKHLATGHYAKIFHPEDGKIFVHTSNDETFDQSSFLSRLPDKILKALMLPLSDLTKKEVLKLAENFGVTEQSPRIPVHKCLTWGEEMKKVFEKCVPERFRPPGEIESVEGDLVASHEGVYQHSYGEEFDLRESGKPIKRKFGKYSFQDKKMCVFPEEFFIRGSVLLTDCYFSQGTRWPEPKKGVVKVSNTQITECWIHQKTLSSVYLELLEPCSLKDGETLTVLMKKGKNSKVYLTGRVRLLPIEVKVNDEDEKAPKLDYAKDF